MLAMTIRELPADLITLKLGINVQGGWSLSPRTFMAAVIGFVRIIREKHPVTPIVLVSPIVSPPREEHRNPVGLSLQDIRGQLEEAIERMKDTCGDENLSYINGLTLFEKSWVPGCMPDGLHPNAEGYERLGNRFAENVLARTSF